MNKDLSWLLSVAKTNGTDLIFVDRGTEIGKSGLHIESPSEEELHDAICLAETQGLSTIYIHVDKH